MTVAKVMEVTSRSAESFEDAIHQGIDRAKRTVDHVEGAWVKEQKVNMNNGQIENYQVDLKITFVLNE